jgi:DNA-binding transcriptional LysR family regulator
MDRVSSMLSFVKVVEHGGFSSAARQLNLATSVVTTHVKSLEERLGVRLLNRTTRNVSLTKAGRAYYERCVQILSEIEDAEEAAQVLQSKPRGVLRLNTSPGIPAAIASSIAEYNELYSDVTQARRHRSPDVGAVWRKLFACPRQQKAFRYPGTSPVMPPLNEVS